MVGCSGPAPRPATPTEAVAPAPEPPPPEPEPVALEDDPVPDGAACFSTEECGDGEHCRGPAGCEADWACGAPRECGDETVSYCGCDGMTFYAPANCPGRPFASAGPCEALGEVVDDSEAGEAIEGNTICRSNDDCRRGFVCAGLEGCGTLWTCVRRRRVRPRCGRAAERFCSCDGETFEASATCPGRPFVHRGYCPGDEPEPEPPAVAAREPEPPAPPPAAEPPPPPRPSPPPAPEPPAARPTPPPTPEPPPEPPTCTSNRDCPRGQICQGPEGCDAAWRCGRPAERCVADTQYFCGCDGQSFTASMTCPGRPHRHRGSCPPAD